MTSADPSPQPCAICVYHMLPEDAPLSASYSPGIGRVCSDCAAHIISACDALSAAPGIARHLIPDGERNTAHI